MIIRFVLVKVERECDEKGQIRGFELQGSYSSQDEAITQAANAVHSQAIDEKGKPKTWKSDSSRWATICMTVAEPKEPKTGVCTVWEIVACEDA